MGQRLARGTAAIAVALSACDSVLSKPSPDDVDAGTGVSSSVANVVVEAPAGLEFGDQACGTVPAARPIIISNEGTADITFSTMTATGDAFDVSPSKGSIAAGGTVMLSVSIARIPADGPVGMRENVIVITTDAAGDMPRMFPVRMRVAGAIFKASPGSYDYGTVPSNESKSFAFSNTGNIDAALAYTLTTNDGNSFRASGSPTMIAAGATVSKSIVCDPPNGGSLVKNGTLTFSSTANLCGPIPAPIKLTCRRKND